MAPCREHSLIFWMPRPSPLSIIVYVQQSFGWIPYDHFARIGHGRCVCTLYDHGCVVIICKCIRVYVHICTIIAGMSVVGIVILVWPLYVSSCAYDRCVYSVCVLTVILRLLFLYPLDVVGLSGFCGRLVFRKLDTRSYRAPGAENVRAPVPPGGIIWIVL